MFYRVKGSTVTCYIAILSNSSIVILTQEYSVAISMALFGAASLLAVLIVIATG